MLRWTYLKPRLILLGLLWAFCFFAVDPILRWGFVQGAQAAAGAKVELSKLKTHFFPPSIALYGLAVADKSAPMTNLIELSEARLSLDGRALLKKRTIVEDATVSGLTWGTPRKTSGELHIPPSEFMRKFQALGAKGVDFASAGAKDLKAKAAEKVEVKPEELASYKLAGDLKTRWATGYVELDAKATALEAGVKEVRALIDNAPKDDLKKLQAYKAAAEKGLALLKEADKLKAEAAALAGASKSDLDKLGQAKQDDLKALMARLKLPSFDAQSFAAELLGPALAAKLGKTLEWVHWTRAHMRPPGSPPQPARSRGVVIEFPGPGSLPAFALRHAALDGRGKISGAEVSFKGRLEGLSSNPALWGKPAELSLEASGGAAGSLKALADHTQPIAHDKLAVNLSGLAVGEQTLGRTDSLSVAVSPGRAGLRGELSLDGEALGGELAFVEEGVSLRPKLAGVEPILARAAEGALSGVKKVEVRVGLSGTLKDPGWSLRSNLGESLASGMRDFFGRELEAKRRELEAQVEGLVKGRRAELEQLLEKQTHGALGKIELSEKGLKELQARLADAKDQKAQELKKELEQKARKALPKDLKKLFK